MAVDEVPEPEDANLLARAGNLEARLTTDIGEIHAAQRLRYDVFYREMSATPTPEMAREGRDFDKYDDIVDHLVVFDHSIPGDTPRGAVVACYRLLRKEVADRHGGFYSAAEYDIGPMLAKARSDAKYLELGRSCVAKAWRSSNQTMQFLWRGLLVYLLRNQIELMFGCASLPGTDPEALKLPLSYLYHYHLTPEEDRVRALPSVHVNMNMLPKEAINADEGELSLPPLIKGYIRLGASIGDGAFIDHQFGTTDVFIYFPSSKIDPRYLSFFKRKLTQG